MTNVETYVRNMHHELIGTLKMERMS